MTTPIQQPTRVISQTPGKATVLVPPSPITQQMPKAALPIQSPTPNPIAVPVAPPKQEATPQESIKDINDVTRLADINLKKEAELSLPDDSASSGSSLSDEPQFINMARLKKKMLEYGIDQNHIFNFYQPIEEN